MPNSLTLSPISIRTVEHFSDPNLVGLDDDNNNWIKVNCGEETDDETIQEPRIYNGDSLSNNINPDHVDILLEKSLDKEDRNDMEDSDEFVKKQECKDKIVGQIPFEILLITVFWFFMYSRVWYCLIWLILFLIEFSKCMICVIPSLYLVFRYRWAPSLVPKVKDRSEFILELETVETVLEKAIESCKNEGTGNKSDLWNEYCELIYTTCLNCVIHIKSYLKWIRTYENTKEFVSGWVTFFKGFIPSFRFSTTVVPPLED